MTPQPPLKLLYVDDDRINTLLFVETCRPDSALEVATAACGSDALQLAAEFTPDVLVIDFHLPDTDGPALLSALRESPALRTAPAFLCTAEQIEAAREPALKAGFDGVWIKPVELASIRQDMHSAAMARKGAR
ncbi:MAG: response regulator [Rubrivivax sp.]|jgi:two-component system OmpR family response regulator|nr:response regulator [Rubrivivax sp.]